MNKKQLIEEVSVKTGLTKKDTKATLDTILEVIEKKLITKSQVRLTGFGTFSTSESEARVGRNPATGENMDINAKTRVKFTAGKLLKEVVNNGK